MKLLLKPAVLFLVGFIISSCNNGTIERGNLILWYDKPASVWNEALPVGNGRLGAMIYGDPENEKIQLNEETFWSGGPSRNDNPKALNALPEVRRLIFEGKSFKAEKLADEKITAEELHGSIFQVIGSLNLSFPDHSDYTDYYRELDLEKAVFKTTYKVSGIDYSREVFASIPDQVIVIRLTASEPQSLTFTAGIDGPLRESVKSLDANTLEMTGLSSTHEGVRGQVKFNARAKIINERGSVTNKPDVIKVENADKVIILISIATNFLDYKSLSDDRLDRSIEYLSRAEELSYPDLLNRHIAAYQEYFNRVTLDLGTSPAAKLPTDVRIRDFSENHDPHLVALYFQFGRYLLISSSQPGGQPANLQGIWNESTHPPWDSKYTININTEMNYWPAEKCNLAEMHEPLIRMVKELSESCRETALTMYGARGWVTHHNTDIWRTCGVVDGAFWGMWPMGGAWLSQHLWKRYLYNGDLEYLASVYPVLRSACSFFQDFLIEEPTNGWLVVSPSVSPENAPAGRSPVCAGATMDNQILFDLFSNTIKGANLLNKDDDLIAGFQDVIDRLPPMQIGRYGQLQEWLEDLDDPEDDHRHVSHLYGLSPSNQISPYSSPELFDAARTSLIHRGDVSTGWSMGWKINLWARLFDGNHALKLITDHFTLVDPVQPESHGGTYPNFLSAHPPYQIDGNFGGTAGIAEMLLQYHNGDIHFLPALPDEWKDGEIKGLRTYGGFEVGFNWKNGKVKRIEIKSTLGGNCRIRVPNRMAPAGGAAFAEAVSDNPNPFFDTPNIKSPIISPSATLSDFLPEPTFLYDFPTEAGETYIITYLR